MLMMSVDGCVQFHPCELAATLPALSPIASITVACDNDRATGNNHRTSSFAAASK